MNASQSFCPVYLLFQNTDFLLMTHKAKKASHSPSQTEDRHALQIPLSRQLAKLAKITQVCLFCGFGIFFCLCFLLSLKVTKF